MNTMDRIDRLTKECEKLDKEFEQELAEEMITSQFCEWDEY